DLRAAGLRDAGEQPGRALDLGEHAVRADPEPGDRRELPVGAVLQQALGRYQPVVELTAVQDVEQAAGEGEADRLLPAGGGVGGQYQPVRLDPEDRDRAAAGVRHEEQVRLVGGVDRRGLTVRAAEDQALRAVLEAAAALSAGREPPHLAER